MLLAVYWRNVQMTICHLAYDYKCNGLKEMFNDALVHADFNIMVLL